MSKICFIFTQLNISKMFDDQADLSELSQCNGKIRVDKIVQKAHFGIDELGTIGTKGGVRRGSEFHSLLCALKNKRIFVKI